MRRGGCCTAQALKLYLILALDSLIPSGSSESSQETRTQHMGACNKYMRRACSAPSLGLCMRRMNEAQLSAARQALIYTNGQLCCAWGLEMQRADYKSENRGGPKQGNKNECRNGDNRQKEPDEMNFPKAMHTAPSPLCARLSQPASWSPCFSACLEDTLLTAVRGTLYHLL